MKPIYLDYSATTPINPSVARAMHAFESEVFGNPSSVHSFGREAMQAVDQARATIANILGCQPFELIFTSSGTEADNLAIKGIATLLPKGHIITSATEHKAVLASCQTLEKSGWSVTYLKPNAKGLITPSQVEQNIRPDTRLVSIIYINNETGQIQPIREIGKTIEKLNRQRIQPIRFHTDAVQAGNLYTLDTNHLHVDLMTIAGHKLYGPKGVGLLFVKNDVSLAPQILGGSQNGGARAGTLFTAGIVGLAKAMKLQQKAQAKTLLRITALSDWLAGELMQNKKVTINHAATNHAPHIVNLSVSGYTSDELVIYFDRHGFAVSAGSACSSGSIEPSHVLAAMNLSPTRVASAMRISLGTHTTKNELKKFLVVLNRL